MRKRTSVGKWTSPGKQSGKHTYIQRPTVSHRVQFLLRWADEEMQGGRNSWMCVWESLVERVQGKLRLKGTHWAEQKAAICRQFGLSKKNSASPLGGAGFRGIHRPSLRRKKKSKTARGGKEKKWKKEKWAGFVFQTQSHSWQHLSLSLPKEGGKRRDERGRERERRKWTWERERADCFLVCFFSFFLFAPCLVH